MSKPIKYSDVLNKPRRNLDYAIPELLSNLEADLALFEESGDPGDLADALRGIQKILMEITGDSNR